MPTTATPNLLTDPGYLFWAPLATAVPAHTVTAGKFSDAWPAAWINLGATEDGSQFSYSTTVEALRVAEFFHPVRWSTTDQAGNFAFNLANYTLANLKRAMNGGAITVSGTAGSELNKYTPPAPGNEIRAMIGWESLDNTVRTIAYQCINSGEIASAFRKAPAVALIPCQFNFEVPASGVPFEIWTAGTTRA
jgi:hypothetical protein